MKVRTLLRVSSKKQLHDDDIPIQRAEAMQYIAQHSNWVFDKEYIEKAVSAYKNSVKEREVLQEILADAQNHEFDILLTYMSDRIGRQEEYSFYVAALNQLGIEVWTIRDGQLKTRDHVDKLLNYIRFWQNEGESKKTGMRVRDTQKELVKAGKFVGGRAPYGYRLVPSGMVSNHGRLLKRLEIVEEKAQVVRQIYHLAVYQGMGYEKIAKELNRQNIPAIETDQWKSGTIRSILTNPVYMGYLALNRRISGSQGEFIRLDRKKWIYSRDQIPELIIISRQIWEKAQEIREARKNKTGTIPINTSGRLVLTGLAVCGYCGKRLKNGSYRNHWTTKSGEKKMAYAGRYVCPRKCEERSCYSQNYLEEIVFTCVENYMKPLKIIDLAKEFETMQNLQKQRLIKKLEDINQKQKSTELDVLTLEEKIPEAIRGDYYFSAEKLSFLIREKELEKNKLEQEEKLIKNELRLIEEQSSDWEDSFCAAPNWIEELRNADTQTQKMLLSSLISKIEVKNADINIIFKIRPEDF